MIQYPPMTPLTVPIGTAYPEIINAIVEIPKGSRNKYEYDEALGIIRLDRVLHSSVVYPTHYGFVPETRSDDGDMLDILIFITEPVFPGCVLSVRPIGLIDMDDDKGKDWKVVSVAHTDSRYATAQNLDDIEDHFKKEIQQFFEVYKQLENKTVIFNGWLPREKAYEVIRSSHEKFLKE